MVELVALSLAWVALGMKIRLHATCKARAVG
jgi:hypothetical protein